VPPSPFTGVNAAIGGRQSLFPTPPQGLSQRFGICGTLDETHGPQHVCYQQDYRLCQPAFNDRWTLGWGSVNVVAQGLYSCASSVMTILNTTVWLSTLAAAISQTGLTDALQTPLADVTLFAADNRAWLIAIGPLAKVLASPNLLTIVQQQVSALFLRCWLLSWSGEAIVIDI